MACDLVVSKIVFPATVVAPCPTPVEVEITNLGPDPARFPIDVCLDVYANRDGPIDSHHVEWLEKFEGEGPPQTLPKMGKATAHFNVSFPCVAQAWLEGTADCLGRVLNNIRSNPSKGLLVSPIGKAPWLTTAVRVGVRDTLGGTTWDPPRLCPSSTLVVEAQITNRGCAQAPASVTELRLLDSGGQVLPGGMKRATPTIPPLGMVGSTVAVTFLTTVPSVPHGVPLSSLVIDVCADSTNAVTGQCDRAAVCKSVSRPVITSQLGPPQVSFAVDAPILPGEEPRITWAINNGCSDLGMVTATIQFNGTDIYTSQQVPVPPLSAGGEQGATIPRVTDPAIVDLFYAVGTHTIDLRIDASGNDPGPYTASAVVTVVPEPVGPSWWVWGTGGASASWKRQYPVLGTLINRGIASMVPVAISIRERPGPTPGTGPGTLTPADPFSQNPLSNGAPLIAGLSSVFQQWSWTQGPDFTVTGLT
jgi:hypothetical protein